MNKRLRLSCLLVAAAHLVGCGQNDQNNQSALAATVAAQQQKIAELSEQVSTMSSDILDLKLESSKSATFDITSKGYAKIDHNNGFFLISLVDVQVKGDGQELTFRFGNPLAAQFTGAKMKVTWWPRPKVGRKQPGYFKELLEAEKKKQERVVEITETLRQGSWSAVKVVIAPATAENAGFVEISEIVTDQLSLTR